MSEQRWTGEATGPIDQVVAALTQALDASPRSAAGQWVFVVDGAHVAVRPTADGSVVTAVGALQPHRHALNSVSDGRLADEPDWRAPRRFSVTNERLVEASDDDGFARNLAIHGVLHAETTPFQDLLIVDTVRFGRALYLDGAIQSAASDEATYHDALVHPTMLAHPHPRRVLVGGGGEGATLREVLKHDVDLVRTVDIDERVVSACQAHLGWGREAWDDPRGELVIGDFIEHLNCGERYDVILVDITDAILPAILDGTVVDRLAHALNDGGVIGVQCGELDISNPEPFEAVCAALRRRFPTLATHATWIASFAAHWGFAVSQPPARFTPWFTAADYQRCTCLPRSFDVD